MHQLTQFSFCENLWIPGLVELLSIKGSLKNQIEYWQAAMDMGIKSIKLEIIEVEQHDDTTIEMSNYSLSSVDDQVIEC